VSVKRGLGVVVGTGIGLYLLALFKECCFRVGVDTNPNPNIPLTITLTVIPTRTLNRNRKPKAAFFNKKIGPDPAFFPTPLLNGGSTYCSSKSHALLKAKAKVQSTPGNSNLP